MNEIIYLESSEEITSVIDRMRANSAHSIAFVIPRGATIAQSIVNLKLLKKSATEMGKEISLVANDRISRNLASQIGLTVYSKVSEAERPAPKKEEPKISASEHEENSGQFRVNNYYRNKKEDTDEDKEDIKRELEEMSKSDEAESEAVPEIEMTSRTVGEAMAEAEHKEKDTNEKEEEPEKPKDHHIERIQPRKEKGSFKPVMSKPTNIKGSRKPLIILFSSAALILIVLAYLFLPYTTVAITVKTDDLQTSKEITIDRNAQSSDASKLILQGKLLEQEKELTKTFSATGKKDVGEKASGKLKVYNSLDTSAHLIAKGTKFVSGGKTFVSSADVTVPAATPTLINGVPGVTPGVSGDVAVAADQPGDSYNIGAGDFTVTGMSSKITAKSSSAMAGGVTKEIKIVTGDDLQKAQDSIKTEASTSGKTDLFDLAKKDNLSIFDNSDKSEILSTSSSKQENDEADTFDCTLKIKLYAIGFVKKDLDSLLIDNINSSLGDKKMLVNPASADIKYDLTDNNIDSGVLTLDAKFTGKTGPKISDSVIKNEVKGKSLSKAKQLASSKDGIESVEIKSWPNKMPELPWLTKRIKVTFDFAK